MSSVITKEQLSCRRMCRKAYSSYSHNLIIHIDTLHKIEDHFTGAHPLRRQVLARYVKRASISILKAESAVRKIIQEYPRVMNGPMPPDIQESYQRIIDATNVLLTDYCQFIRDHVDLINQG